MSRLREKLSKSQIRERLEDIAGEIDQLQSEVDELEEEAHDLRDALKNHSGLSNDDEITVGPRCMICEEFEPIFSKEYCDDCQGKAIRLLDMGKEPRQIAAGDNRALGHIERIAVDSGRRAS